MVAVNSLFKPTEMVMAVVVAAVVVVRAAIDFFACKLYCETRLKVFSTNCGRGIIKVAPQCFHEHVALFAGRSFEGLGLENVSHELRLSAVAQLRALHEQAAVLHGDVRLGNIITTLEVLDLSHWCRL
ncbi:hypothetical protein B484DRAFT_406770 [Ochromonadaceae sp. CCMP2298]|nr:hypothetical protein B484DRAFT_406770 [Ochromonadaceae sp. CCMP2298]